jgi:glycosyltransferase involved in cell wall biosynthesis
MSAASLRQREATGAVVIVAAGELFAGAERQILALLTHLASDKWAATLSLFYDRELAKRARALGVDVVILPEQGLLRVSAIRCIAALVRRKRASVVHFHGYKAAAHVAVARLLLPFGSVATIHGAPELGGGSRLFHLRSHFYDCCERFAIRMTRAIVVFVTHDLETRMSALRASARHCVVPNGIDRRTVANLPRPAELTAPHFNVVVAGRLDAVKGVTFAIGAMRDPSLAPSVRLCVVGEGPERLRLERESAAYALTDRIVFTGFRVDAAAFIAHADVVLIPSLHEGLPYTMLEAIAAGTPILASAVGGLAETLRQKRTALLFPPGDVPSIVSAIAAVAADPTRGKDMALRAQHELLPRFEATAMAHRYQEIYAIAGSQVRS